jgi:WD40 repeat protein/class 3 adenylate cyclase
MKIGPRSARSNAEQMQKVRTFLIADIRGYTTFTREHGDQAAAQLAKRFADRARDAVEARNGRVIELRGDEALGVFSSAEQAVRAALEFQQTCREETDSDPALPLRVGIGIDTGEAIPVEDGFRGRALNTAARLCSKAEAGQVLMSRAAVDSCGVVDGLSFEERGTVELKGFDAPVGLMEPVRAARPSRPAIALQAAQPLPLELDTSMPMVGREHEIRWLRGTWRQAKRGDGRLVFVSGPDGIGKTRLAAELAEFAQLNGADVRSPAAGGIGTASALTEIARITSVEVPTLVVVDDLEIRGERVLEALSEALASIPDLPVLVIAIFRGESASRRLTEVVSRADNAGDGHRALGSLEAAGVAEIIRLYVGDEVQDAPLESMMRASKGVPGHVHELAADWARDELNRRLAAAAQWMAEGRARQSAELEFANNTIALRLGRLYASDSRVAERSEDCPYKGLASFDRDDASYFFGRERMVGELAARTVGSGLLGVVGPSGSGKSSLVLAGLLPSLTARLLPGSDRWRQEVIRPGEDPMAALTPILQEPTETRLVLVVDQFEELFTSPITEEERTRFVDALTAIAKEPEHTIVVLTIRADYYGHCAAYPVLAELLAANQVLVGSMSAEELRRAIELPARRVGLRVESVLVDALVREVVDEPGGLPLLSTALVEVWQARDSGWLRMDAYERAGGVRGAVARLAEASFAQLEGDEPDSARAVLLRLVGDDEAGVRRRVAIGEFDRTPAVQAVLARFAQDRLITVSEGTVEISHEALIREWPRLRAWLEDDIQGRQILGHITQAAKQWDLRGRDRAELYRGTRLSVTLDWAALHGRELNQLEREFLSESHEASELEAQRQRRTNRRLRGLLVGVGVFLVIALVAGALAFVQRANAKHSAQRALRVARIALAKSLGAQAVVDPQLDQAMVLARESVNLAVDPQTRNFLLTTLQRSPQAIGVLYTPAASRPFAMALSPDGQTLAIGENSKTIIFRDTRTDAPIGPSLKNEGPLVAYSPDGSELVTIRVASTGQLQRIDIFDATTHKRMMRLPIPAVVSNTAFYASMSFAPDGRTLLVAFGAGPPAPGYLVRYELRTGHQQRLIALTSGVSAARYNPSGKRIIAVGRATVVLDARTRRVIRRFSAGTTAPVAAISPNARTVLLPQGTNSLEFMDLRTGKKATAPGAESGGSIGFSPNGKTLIVTGDTHTVQLWDVASHSIRTTLSGHGGPVHVQAISQNGSTLYTGSLDATIFEWDLTGARSFGQSFRASAGDSGPQFGEAPNLAISPDGTTIATGQTNGTVILRNLSTHKRITSFHAMDGQIVTVSFGPQGRTLVVAGDRQDPSGAIHGAVEIWRLGDHPSLLRTLHGLDLTSWATYTPNGNAIVASGGIHSRITGGRSLGSARVAEWSASSGELLAPPTKLPTFAAFTVASNANGSRVAAGLPDGRAVVVDPTTQKVVTQVHSSGGIVLAVAISPDGDLLATGSDIGTTQLWDMATGTPIGTEMKAANEFVIGAEFSRDAQSLLTAGSDGSTRLFDVQTQREIGNPFPGRDQIWDEAAFTPDQSKILAVFSDGRAYLWPVALRSWENHACDVARRNFTAAEWHQFLGSSYPYTKVCG